MELLLAVVVGTLYAGGIYLLLKRRLAQIIVGLSLLANASNLLIFTSAGLMPDVEDQTVVLEGSARDAAAVGITVEPESGSEQPTTEPIAVFDLTEAT